MAANGIEWAWALAQRELATSLPRRWAHVTGVARAAKQIAHQLNCDSELLIASAILHDIGYAPRLVATGFHPLDGGRYLRDAHHVDDRLARLVANHTFALLEAEERGLRSQLETEFPHPDELLLDALTYCDVTTAPDGSPTTAADRIEEIVVRYGPDTLVGRFIQRAAPHIHATVARIEEKARLHPR